MLCKRKLNQQLHFCVLYISETPPPAYSPPEDSQHGQSTTLTDPSAMDTSSSIMSEVAPVSYQVNTAVFFLYLMLVTLVHNQYMDVADKWEAILTCLLHVLHEIK